MGHLFYTTWSFVQHLNSIGEVKLELQSGYPQFRVTIGNFLSHMTLKFDGWPWKTKGHLFYTALSLVQHFKAIGIYKLELQSGNAQFGSKLATFCPARPRKLTDDLEKQKGTCSMVCQALCIISKPSVNSNWSYSPETLNFGSKLVIFLSRVTLKIDGWP